MLKYELLPEQLILEGIASRSDFFTPGSLTEEVITWTHDALYLDKLVQGQLSREEIRRTGFPYSKMLVEREVNIAAGTVQCALFALESGVSLNIAGGTHHAFSDRGEGFCILNDLAIASNYLLKKFSLSNILIIDLDVHQGNGTAEIFHGNSKVFTFSMHGEKNYPLKKEKSDLDISLADGTGDGEYLLLLNIALDDIFNDFLPEFVFYQSGVDVLDTDKLGRLSLSLEGCKRRDEIVINKCYSKSIPLVICMGGGYSPTLGAIIDAHTNTFRIAKSIYF